MKPYHGPAGDLVSHTLCRRCSHTLCRTLCRTPRVDHNHRAHSGAVFLPFGRVRHT